jgi:hypothetical protein
MKTRTLIALAGAAALLSACIPSVNPFFTEKDIAFDARLVGEWRGKEEADAQELWKFEADGTNAYKLTVTEKEGKQGEFEARLFKLRREAFLDLIPSDCDYATNQADLVSFSMFPGHLLVRVTQIEPEMKLAFFDFEWLQKHLEKNPKALTHHKEGDRIVLTATTKELQSFVLKHVSGGELFDEPGVMVRR